MRFQASAHREMERRMGGRRGPAVAKPYRVHLTRDERVVAHAGAAANAGARDAGSAGEVRLSDLGWSVPRTRGARRGMSRRSASTSKRSSAPPGVVPDHRRSGHPMTLPEAHPRAVERLLDEVTAPGGHVEAAAHLVWRLEATHGLRTGPKQLPEWLRQRRFRWKRTKRPVQHRADPVHPEQARAELAVLSF